MSQANTVKRYIGRYQCGYLIPFNGPFKNTMKDRIVRDRCLFLAQSGVKPMMVDYPEINGIK